jgi:hypothetical protein
MREDVQPISSHAATLRFQVAEGQKKPPDVRAALPDRALAVPLCFGSEYADLLVNLLQVTG